MLINAKIEEAGLYYNGHYKHYSLRIVLRTPHGGGASIELPTDKTEEFMEMFDEELDLENGVFVNELKDIPVVLKLDGDDRFQGKIVAIGSILASEDELLPIE